MSNYQEKYKKALRSIEEIIKANKQIKDELDALRTMRQAELDSFANIQKEEFRKAYDALLKEKNSLVISLQSLELENQKLKFTVAELENQVELYRNDRFQKSNDQRLTLQSNQQSEGIANDLNSPRKGENKEVAALLREKQEFHRTIENYEQHHSNLTRANKRLQERIGELENKSATTQKNWRIKYQAKELEIIEAKSFARQEFSDQINQLRKENSSLKLSNNDLILRLESADRSTQFNKNLQSFDWQAELVQQMINVRANLQPLRQQITEMQQLSQYQKEQAIRDRTNLQTRVLELEAEVERQNETIKNMEKKAMDVHREKAGFEDRSAAIKRLEEENQVLNGKIIVMESREIALRNRTGEELEERVLEFENRIELLLSNKEGLRELREIGIHQLLALKAYIMQLDSKLKELLLSNAYLLKKYKGYKQKYQSSLKEQKQLGMTINSLKMKILGYDKLVQKLQGELQRMVKNNEYQLVQISSKKADESQQDDIYRKKYELMVEKLKIQEKYKEQEIETLKLNYEARIMDLAIRAEEVKSIKETLELYKSKNQELQGALSKKEAELFESKVLTGSKVNVSEDQIYSTRNSKDIIANLHISLKQNDQTIFRLQTQLRNKQDTYKRSITKLQRDLNDLKEEHIRELSKRELEYNITLDQEVKKYKIKISDLEHNHHINSQSSKDEIGKKIEESEAKVRKLEVRITEAETKREEEAFTRRRLEKQIIDLTHDKEELQRNAKDLQLKLSQLRSLQKQNDDLKSKLAIGSKQQSRDSFNDYELQSKQATIRRLNVELSELKSALGSGGEKDILISSQKNEIYYLKREVEELNETINKYNNQITFLKGTLDTNKNTYSSQFGGFLEEKQGLINKLRKDLTAKDAKIYEIEDEKNTLQQANRKLKRDLTEINRYKEEIDSLQRLISDKDRAIEKYRASESNYEQEYERLKEELTFIKENYQRVNYELLEKNDEISKLSLQINTNSIRNRQQIEARFSEQLSDKERVCSRLNSQVISLKSTLVMTEEDRDYHEQNYKRVNTEVLNLKGQINQLQDENDSFREQLYFKAQDISKLQYSADNYKADLESKTEEFYRMSTEVFSLKSDVSTLQDEIFTRQAMIARLNNEMGYLRTQYSELQEELDAKQEYLNKLTEEYNKIRSKLQESQHFYDEKDRSIQKLTSDLNSIRGKYRDLEEEMEEREQSFSNLTQELARFKSNLTFYQQQIDEKNSIIARMTNQKQLLKSQIIRLNQVISDKSSQVNRAKQQIFSMKMQAGQREHQEKMKIDQQIYSYKNKITLLEHEIEDKEAEIRMLHIDIDAVRNRPVIPQISEEEVAELRSELMKKQREFVGIKLDIDDYQYQIQTLTNTVNMQKRTIAEYQQRLISEREEYETVTRDYKIRERKLQDQISILQEQNERKSVLTETKPVSYMTSYSEEEMSSMRQQYKIKVNELSLIRQQLQEKIYLIQTLERKAKKLEELVRQTEQQANEDRSLYQQKIRYQQWQSKKDLQQIQEIYEADLLDVQRRLSMSPAVPAQPSVHAAPAGIDSGIDQTQMIRNYIEEIDRLNTIIRELQQDVSEFKLKLSSLINHENKVEENLITMVELFSELDTVRNRIRNREREIGDVRKSFMQLGAENTQMNKLIEMVNSRKNINSEEQIESDFAAEKEQIQIQPFRQIQGRVEQRNNLQIQRTNQVSVSGSQSQNVIVSNHVISQNAAPQGIARTEERVESSEVRGSLIQELQREQDLSASEVKGGQITIKIQTSNQYVPNQQQIHQALGQQKVVQYIGPNGQPVRVIQHPQQVQQIPQVQLVQSQHAFIPQTGHYQSAFIQQGTSPRSSGLHPAAIAQSIGIPRPINYVNLPPHSIPVNRSLP